MEFPVQLDGDFSQAWSDRNTTVKQVFTTQQIQRTNKFTGVKVQYFTAFFKLIKFLKPDLSSTWTILQLPADVSHPRDGCRRCFRFEMYSCP